MEKAVLARSQKCFSKNGISQPGSGLAFLFSGKPGYFSLS
jgi:hypothetical protein